jgi:hypothetical protein
MRIADTREAWLLEACEHLRPLLHDVGAECPPVSVSIGFPKGGRGRSQAIGQCWPERAAADGRPAVFVSPVLVDAERILDVLLHELVHAAVGTGCGHRGKFVTVARACGLIGPATATTAGPELKRRLYAISQALGPLPHAALSVVERPKQTTRLRLWECACKVKVRVASDQFDATCNRCGSRFMRKD